MKWEKDGEVGKVDEVVPELRPSFPLGFLTQQAVCLRHRWSWASTAAWTQKADSKLLQTHPVSQDVPVVGLVLWVLQGTQLSTTATPAHSFSTLFHVPSNSISIHLNVNSHLTL